MNQDFITLMTQQLGADAPTFFASCAMPYVRGIRMNQRVAAGPPDGTLDPVPWAENAFYLANDSLAGASIAHTAGAFYIQEPSAMIPAMVLAPSPHDTVLDLCAAPGGKTTQLSDMLSGGTLVSNEINDQRAQILSGNVERMGCANVVVTSASPNVLADKWREFFDKVLVDAPCSGEGMFRRHPETMLEWSKDAPLSCMKRQAEILDSAAQMLKPGGKMVYSTCTFNHFEDEDTVHAFLVRHPDFSLVPFALPGLPPAGEGILHIYPHQVRGEGHFVALMQKEEGTCDSAMPMQFPIPPKDQVCDAHNLLSDLLQAPGFPLFSFAGRLICPPPRVPPLQGVRVLRVGLQAGSFKGKAFIPDHALSHACKAKDEIALDEKQARMYLHGETIPCPDAMRGFCLLSYQGMALGFGKASGGQIKNHFPKGIRE